MFHYQTFLNRLANIFFRGLLAYSSVYIITHLTLRYYDNFFRHILMITVINS